MQLIHPEWPAPANVRAFSTTRLCPIYREPNIKQCDWQKLFGLPTGPLWLQQMHSNAATEALPENLHAAADASFSQHESQVCAIMTADCLPILLCHKAGTQVAAAHAGWRGLACGVISNTVSKLSITATTAADWLAWLGPAISQRHFEIGHEVYEIFMQQFPQSRAAFVPGNLGKWYADLYEIARIQLRAVGIIHFFGGDFCTYSQADLFFSYRRDPGEKRRLVSLIWLE